MRARRVTWLGVAATAVGLLVAAWVLTACGGSGSKPGAAAGNTAKPQAVKLIVKSDTEHGKKGPDGNWHDAFLPADFSVRAGAPVTVTVYNYDDAAHSFSSRDLGIDQIVPAGDANSPSQTTFTFTPTRSGAFEWYCYPACDPWAMDHNGYMRGVVNVTA